MGIVESSETSAHLLTVPLPESLYGPFSFRTPQPLSYVCVSLSSLMMTCFRTGGYGLFVKIAPALNYSYQSGCWSWWWLPLSGLPFQKPPGGTGMIFRELSSRALHSNPCRRAACALRKGFIDTPEADNAALCSLSSRSWPEPVCALYFHTVLLSDNWKTTEKKKQPCNIAWKPRCSQAWRVVCKLPSPVRSWQGWVLLENVCVSF